MPYQSAKELIDVLHSVHCDNSRLQYYAERPGGGRVSIMPLTPFVFEFFLFNSLYQVDWSVSNGKNGLVFHPDDDFSEPKKQRAFVRFLMQHAVKRSADLYRAFDPLLHIERTDDAWTRVTPDARISVSAGEKFFGYIQEFQDLLEQCKTPSDMPTGGRVFEILKECTYFIYLVRNNIFHGSKTLGEVYEQNQKRRIEVYDLFLKGITSLFFLAMGKNSVACDFVPCPIFSSSLPTKDAAEIMDQSSILGATSKGMMKVGDSRLVARFTKVVPPPAVDTRPSDKSALFYPSAGKDFLTPILLGLPYCTRFYFFERSRNDRHPPPIDRVLRKIAGVRLPTNSHGWETDGDRNFINFEFNGIPRRLDWVHADNKAFLLEDVALRFYFHRGDSEGEGGSGQEWDSKLLPELLKMIPANALCMYLTDGEPGGFDTRYSLETFELNMPFIERGRTYYCGRFSPTAENTQPLNV
jgi:hypothetical protein